MGPWALLIRISKSGLAKAKGPVPAPPETSSKLQQLPDSVPAPPVSSSKLLANLQQTPATSSHLGGPHLTGGFGVHLWRTRYICNVNKNLFSHDRYMSLFVHIGRPK